MSDTSPDDTCSPADEYLERVETLGTTDDRTRTLALLSLAHSARELCKLLADAGEPAEPVPFGVTREGRIMLSKENVPAAATAFDAAGFEEYLKTWNDPRLIEPRLINAIVRIAKMFTKEKP